ncbi:MAG: hypothetical protein RR014_01865 [Bilophila sp.]
MRFTSWLLVGLCAFALLGTAMATERATEPATESTGIKVTVRNLTGADLYALHLAPAGSQKWSEDLLEGGCLRMGKEIKVTFPWGARAIWWDIHVENRNGTVVKWSNVPMRRFRILTLLFDGTKPKIRGE